MKLFKTFAATAAVITCCLGYAAPVEASEPITLPGGAKLYNSEKNPDKRRVLMSADEMKRMYGSTNSCPPGTSHYRTKGLFGLGARDIGCMTAYEAESLRRQNYQNFQNNLNRNRMRNCTTNFIGSTAYTNCY